jgi:hypothetical protein
VDNVESSREPLNSSNQAQWSSSSTHHFVKKVATKDQPMVPQSAPKQSIYQACCPPSLTQGENVGEDAPKPITFLPSKADISLLTALLN